MDVEKNTAHIEVITSWVHEFSDKLYARALFQTNDATASEDLVQDTFFAAVKSFETFDHRSKPSTWLFAILNNKIADFHRKKSKENQRHNISPKTNAHISAQYFNENGEWQPESRPEDWQIEETHPLDDEDLMRALEKCLSKLPSHWHAAVKYKFLEEKETQLICQELEITLSNYWQIIHRAKLQLRECIENKWYKG